MPREMNLYLRKESFDEPKIEDAYDVGEKAIVYLGAIVFLLQNANFSEIDSPSAINFNLKEIGEMITSLSGEALGMLDTVESDRKSVDNQTRKLQTIPDIYKTFVYAMTLVVEQEVDPKIALLMAYEQGFKEVDLSGFLHFLKNNVKKTKPLKPTKPKKPIKPKK